MTLRSVHFVISLYTYIKQSRFYTVALLRTYKQLYHTYNYLYLLSFVWSLVHILAYSRFNIHTCIHTLTHTRAKIRTRARAHTISHTHTHTHTQTTHLLIGIFTQIHIYLHKHPHIKHFKRLNYQFKLCVLPKPLVLQILNAKCYLVLQVY